MNIIMDTDAKFNISVNPFLQEVNIIHLPSRSPRVWRYKELDEWREITFEDGSYDFHFEYTEHLEFHIYPVQNGETNTLECIPLNLSIEF